MTPPPPTSTLFPYTTLFRPRRRCRGPWRHDSLWSGTPSRSEEHTSELQSQFHLVCRLLLEKKKSPASSALGHGLSVRRLLSVPRPRYPGAPCQDTERPG